MASTRARRAARSPLPSSRPRRGGHLPEAFTTALIALVLAGAAVWAYSTSFRGVFVMDDKFGIVDNPNIKRLWPLTAAMSAPPEMPVSGRPIASLTLAINYALAPHDVRDVMTPEGPPDRRERYLRNVWGYHAFNLALHVLAGLALFGVIRRTLRSQRLRARFGPSSTPLAFVCALIWLVHPLLTDAVTYVVQRTEVLMGLFCLVTLYCAIRATDGERRADLRRWWVAAAIGACALGMGSKQTMVGVPVLVWLWIRTFAPAVPAGPDGAAERRVRWSLYAGLGATWIVLGALVAMERWPHSIGFAREGWTPWTYLLTQTGVIVHYLRLSIVPSPLSLDYDGWPMARSIAPIAPYAALLLGLFAATVLALVRRQSFGYLGAWFFVLLAPSSSVLPLATEIAAERRMYLPLAAIVALAVIGVYRLGQEALARSVVNPQTRRRIGLTLATVVVGGVAASLAGATYVRNQIYWSDERIWRDTVEKRPGNPRARLNYGVDLYAAGRLTDAERELREAIRLRETSAPAHGSLGAVLCRLGQLDEGIQHLERAVALDPEYTPAYGNLGEAYGSRGQRALAAQAFARAVEAAPENPFFLNRLGWLLATSPEDGVRDGARAVALAERAAAITSRQDLMSLDTLSAAYAETGRFDEAVAAAREALALAEQQRNDATARDLAARIALFQAGQKLREPH